MSEPTKIESWEDLDRRLKRVGLLIEEGDLHWQERMVDHMDMLFDRIKEMEAKLQDTALDCLAAQGQAAEAYQAQLAALEALDLADAALSGANMNMRVVEKKVKAAIAELKGKKDE